MKLPWQYKIIEWGEVDRQHHTAKITVKLNRWWVLYQKIKLKLLG